MHSAEDLPALRESLSKAGSGDREAIERLLVRHLPRLRAYIRLRAGPHARKHDDTGDLVQSVCLEILGKAHELHFETEGAFRYWLFTEAARKIAKRVRHHEAHKRGGGRAELGDTALAQCYSSFASPSEHAAVREQIELVEAAFDSLEEHQREIISMAYAMELSRAEIGLRLGLSEGAVRSALHRALACLAARLDSGGAR